MDNPQKRNWIIILIGIPGAGKGTQADLLAEDFGLIHLESSKVIEGIFAEAKPEDEVIREQKEIYAAGKLVEPELVRAWMLDAVRTTASGGRGIVFSGSPRTLFEAEGELPVFEELYGKKNVFAVNIKISPEESIRRNSRRRICQANRHPIPADYAGDTCPKDGSSLIRRTDSQGRSLDDPEVIVKRHKEYNERTAPVLDYLVKRGYTIIGINGEQSIPAVHDDITHALHGMHTSMHLDILEKETQ